METDLRPTVFLTGSTGYVGNRLAHAFAARGFKVKALCRNAAKAGLLTHPSIIPVQGEIGSGNDFSAALEGCDVVIHAAAYAAIYAPNPKLYYDINVEGTHALVKAAKAAGVKKFIFTSTAGSLGPSSNGQETAEHTRREVPFFNDYEKSKSQAEGLVLENNAENFQTNVLHLTRVFGPGLLTEANGTTRLIQQIAFRNFRIIPGDGTKSGNYVFIDDVVSAHELALENAFPGERYIIGGENLTFNEFYDLVKKIAGARQNFIKMPVPLIHSGAWMMKMSAKYLGREAKITPEWSRRYMHHWKLSSQKAREEIDYHTTPINDALKTTIEWLRKNGHAG